nr:MAG TPA: hypothetical protein [Caudoviricetes sp.]
MPNLDRELRNSPKGPRDQLPQSYTWSPTPASRHRPRATQCVKTTARERSAAHTRF